MWDPMRRRVMQARAGDKLTVRGRHQGAEDRHGTIIRVDGKTWRRRTWCARVTGTRARSFPRLAPRWSIMPSRANKAVVARVGDRPPVGVAEQPSVCRGVPFPGVPGQGGHQGGERQVVPAENVVHGSDQQGCSTGPPAVMITDHVPAVRVPPDHAGRSVAAAVPPRGCVEDRGDPDPSPSAHRPATAAMSPAAELGRPRSARGPARCDTQSAAVGPAAAGYPGNDRALAS